MPAAAKRALAHDAGASTPAPQSACSARGGGGMGRQDGGGRARSAARGRSEAVGRMKQLRIAATAPPKQPGWPTLRLGDAGTARARRRPRGGGRAEIKKDLVAQTSWPDGSTRARADKSCRTEPLWGGLYVDI